MSTEVKGNMDVKVSWLQGVMFYVKSNTVLVSTD